MISKLLRKIWLYFNAPKIGDVYYGDSLSFMIGNFNSEKILHQTNDILGDPLYEPVYGEYTYRVTVAREYDGYYACKGEMLALGVKDEDFRWLQRQSSWRFEKERFFDMIRNREIKKREFRSKD